MTPTTIEDNLARMGLTLPEHFTTEYDYIPLSIDDGTLYLAGHIAKTGVASVRHQGRVGQQIGLAEAQENAGCCVLQALSAIRAHFGELTRLERLLMLTVYISIDPDFSEMSKVADGASRILISAFGIERGRHPRSVIGVSRLPRNVPVMVDATWRLKKE